MAATVISRSVAAMPKRSATETWATIIDVLAPDPNDPARNELNKVNGVAASIISADGPKNDPIILFGGGPRVRVYCLYNDDAILGEKASEDPIRQSVTGEGWHLSLPCEAYDLNWIQRQLKSLTICITARELGKEPSLPIMEQNSFSAEQGQVKVDLEEFLKS